jgi:hypothetical protein
MFERCAENAAALWLRRKLDLGHAACSMMEELVKIKLARDRVGEGQCKSLLGSPLERWGPDGMHPTQRLGLQPVMLSKCWDLLS